MSSEFFFCSSFIFWWFRCIWDFFFFALITLLCSLQISFLMFLVMFLIWMGPFFSSSFISLLHYAFTSPLRAMLKILSHRCTYLLNLLYLVASICTNILIPWSLSYFGAQQRLFLSQPTLNSIVSHHSKLCFYKYESGWRFKIDHHYFFFLCYAFRLTS